MKTLTKTLLCVVGLSLVPWAVNAANDQADTKEYQLPEYQILDIEALPEATHSPTPMVPPSLVGTSLNLKLTVDETGSPQIVRLERPLISYSDIHRMTFACQMRDLVAGWKFNPALDANGQAVAVNVIMPVQVVKNGTTPTVEAALVLDTQAADQS